MTHVYSIFHSLLERSFMKKTLSYSLLTLAVLSATSAAYAEKYDYTTTKTISTSAQKYEFDLTEADNNLFRIVTSSGMGLRHQITQKISIVGKDETGSLIGTIHIESANSVAAQISKGGTEFKADTVTLLSGSKNKHIVESYGPLTIEANNLVVSGGGNGLVSVRNGNDPAGSISVKATNVNINTGTRGIYSTDGSDISVVAENLNISSAKAIDVYGSASAEVTATKKASIDGDVKVADDSSASLNLAEGSFNGSFITSTEGTGDLTLGEKSIWTVGTADSTLTNLDSAGTIDMSKTDASIVVTDSFAGNVIKVDATKTNTLTAEGEVTGSVSVVTDQDADTVTQAQASAMVTRMGNIEATARIEEGMYNGAMNVGSTGSVATEANSVVVESNELASLTTLSLNRILTNDVRKRLGDLRSAEGTHGVWARYDGGKFSGASGLENDFTTVQVGIDTVPVAEAPRFGIAFSYTTSEADMTRGSADMDAFSLAFYGTKMYDNGMFVDVIGRMATADTDVVIDGDKKGSMDNVALSLSGEFGWRLDVTNKFYFEPQAELTYTYINADKLTLSNGTASWDYNYGSVDSLVGRVGFAAGFKCPNNFGDIYVRASAVHEFLGDTKITLGNGTVTPTVDGEDTWVEFGIGANFNVNKNMYVYADIERTEGAKLEEDWRANVGVRFAF